MVPKISNGNNNVNRKNVNQNINLTEKQIANTTLPTYTAADTGLVNCYLKDHPDALSYFPAGAARESFRVSSTDPIWATTCPLVVTADRLNRAKFLITTDQDRD